MRFKIYLFYIYEGGIQSERQKSQEVLPTELRAKRQGNETVHKQTVVCECNRWIAEAVSPDSQSKISAKQSTVCGTAQLSRCLCATKDTAEVSRVLGGKQNPCRRPNFVGAVNSYSIRHCAVST